MDSQPLSKLIRMDASEDLTQVFPPAAKVRRAISPAAALTREFSESEDGSAIEVESNAGEKTQDSSSTSSERERKTPTFEPPGLTDIIKKMRKESGTFGFIPLSTGKYLNEVWWEPISCDVLENKKSYPWMLLSVRILLDVAGLTPQVDDPMMNVKFKSSPDDVLRICYIKDRLMKDLHSERKRLSFKDWKGFILRQCKMDERNTDLEIAKAAFDYTMALAITRIPTNFRIFMQKKPHTAIKGIETVATTMNRNSILCLAEGGKGDFYYEFKVRMFVVTEEEEKKGKKPPEHEDI
ncbi:MAG: hypothetical protein J5767_14135 [Paludibacteraceae bacterium]|nr:hypothetical protein [Paludibacteraceae bacterium]